jgi:quercetin dioxygenase-like cupin family protein
MIDPIVLSPDEGEAMSARGSVITFKATGAATGGAFSLMDRTLPPSGRMPPLHAHQGEEAFYILDGEVVVQIGDRSVRAVPGTFVLVPPDRPHTFGNAGDTPARLLILHRPAADEYFRDLAGLWAAATPPTRDAERALMRRHGITPATGSD